jgi:hypothetical protein
MMRSKSRPAKIKCEGKAKKWKAKSKPKSASKPKSKKERTEKKLPYTVKIEFSQGGYFFTKKPEPLRNTW